LRAERIGRAGLAEFGKLVHPVLDAPVLTDDGRREPIGPSRAVAAATGSAVRFDPQRVRSGRAAAPLKWRLRGPIGSLMLHLLPLLAIAGWPHTASEDLAPIPIRLVIEQSPPPQPAAVPPMPAASPPQGRRASDDFAEALSAKPNASLGEASRSAGEPAPPAPAVPTDDAAPPEPSPAAPEQSQTPPEPQQPAGETRTAAAATLPPPKLSAPTDHPSAEPPAAVPRSSAPNAAPKGQARAPAAKPLGSEWPLPLHQDHPQTAQRLAARSGPPAVRDEYCAYALSLTLRHIDLLPLAVVGGRQGTTVLTIRVLGDGTINSVRVAQSSGYSDIDERIEQMVIAVGRYPPLPQWIPGTWMDFTFDLHFPHPLQR